MRLGIIGDGAVGKYVRDKALERGHVIRVLLLRPERLQDSTETRPDTICVSRVADLPDDIDHMIDCAGHTALKSYGPDILRSGIDMTTVSLGALTDSALFDILDGAATEGGSRLDLDNLMAGAETHFDGTARDAATDYPKNANVAAAVALAGIGFDKTQVKLIADPEISENIHEVHASGDFGRFSFEIRGQSLPDNPKSSALAAMSVISTLEQESQRIIF